MCVPTASVSVVSVAGPVASSVTVPRVVGPSANVTVPRSPVAVAGPLAIVTVAVNVTVPKLEGFGLGEAYVVAGIGHPVDHLVEHLAAAVGARSPRCRSR